MRRRERTYFLVLGALGTFALLGGAWPVPLVVFALLETVWSAVEWASERRRVVARRTADRMRATPVRAATGILHPAP
jgi:hypothetical protein